MKRNKFLLELELDQILAILGIFSSIALMLYLTFSVGNIIYVITGFLSFISCILWLLIRKKSSSLQFHYSISSSFNLLSIFIFFILFTISLLSIYFRTNLYERPLTYFILLSLMICAVIIQLFYNKKSYMVILFQIILIGFSIPLSQLLLFPSLLGVDPWFHQMLTLEILKMHSLVPEIGYSKLPLFHLLVSSTSLITGLDYKFSTIFSVSLLQIITNVTFIYLIGKNLFNKNIGLLAALLIVLGNYHIFMSYGPIPNSFASIFILPLFYIFMKIKFKKPFASLFIIFLLIPTLVLSHSITIFFVCLSLFIYWAGFKTFNVFSSHGQKNPINLNVVILATTLMFSWWGFASGHLMKLGKLINWGFSSDYFIRTRSELIQEITFVIPIYEQIFNNIGFFLFFSLSFIGCFYMSSKKFGTSNTFAFALAGFFPLLLGFLSLVTQHGIVEQRWWFFAQIFLSLPLAISFVLLYNYIYNSIKKVKLSLFIFISMIFIISFFLVISPLANTDNNTFSPNSSPRLALTESEMRSIYFLPEIYSETVGVDNYLVMINFLNPNLSVSLINDEIYTGNFYESDIRLFLIRDYILHNPFKLGRTYKLDYDLYNELEKQELHKVYDSNSVYFFYKSETVG